MKQFVQSSLFSSEIAEPLPQGLRYQPDFLSPQDERELVGHIETLPFKEFDFHGFTGKRRTVSFGWKYNFSDRALQKGDDMPEFLKPLRKRVAEFAGLLATDFQHALVIEYQPGAGIGWHRDKPVFDEVVGISLLAPCRFRLRRQVGETWERTSLLAEPRSIYLLSGAARTQWQHSIPPMDRLRYSITFRNFRER
jgi:alkylated DNA repair dioxygenase AlkB